MGSARGEAFPHLAESDGPELMGPLWGAVRQFLGSCKGHFERHLVARPFSFSVFDGPASITV